MYIPKPFPNRMPKVKEFFKPSKITGCLPPYSVPSQRTRQT